MAQGKRKALQQDHAARVNPASTTAYAQALADVKDRQEGKAAPGFTGTLPAPVTIMGIKVVDAAGLGRVSALADGHLDSIQSALVSLLTGATFEEYDRVRVGFRTGYAEQRGNVTANALDKAWSRVLARLTADGFAVPAKPKSTTPAAQAKAGQRVNPFADAATADDVDRVLTAERQRVAADPVALAKVEYLATSRKAAIDKAARKAADKAAASDPARVSLAKLAKSGNLGIVRALDAAASGLFVTGLPADDYAKAWSALFGQVTAEARACLTAGLERYAGAFPAVPLAGKAASKAGRAARKAA